MRTDSVTNWLANMKALCPNCACCAFAAAAIREAQRDMYELCMSAGHSGDYAKLGAVLNSLRETAVEDARVLGARTQDA